MKKIVKSKGVMISSIISLLLSLVVLATVSMAWLSMNKDANSSGMQMKVDVTPNLIIKKTAAELVSGVTGTNADFSVSYQGTVHTLKPCTHDTSFYTSPKQYGLKYVSNPEEVSPSTGLKKASTNLEFDEVSSTNYFFDFTIYLASTGSAMTDVTHLNVTMSGSGANADTLAASSIDFFVGTTEFTPSSTTYAGTLNQAGLTIGSTENQNATHTGHTTTVIDLAAFASITTIPVNTGSGSGFIKVVMRCYFDGDLTKTASSTYINTASINAGDITLSVAFAAVTSS